jgi:predicted permease
MTTLRELWAKLGSFWQKGSRDADFDQELSAHLDLAVDDYLQQGMAPDEARRRALVNIGGMQQAREVHRESRGLPWLDNALQDLRYAVRMLRRDAGLSTFAILIIGLGVAASSTVFTVVNALLLQPLPFADSDRLVWIANGKSENLSSQTVQVANLRDLQSQSQSLEAVAGYSPFYNGGDIQLTGVGEPERLTGVPVTENFFPLLGIQPKVGRLFTPAECVFNAPKTVLLSHAFWRRRFGSNPAVNGQTIVLDGAPSTIVGVLPASFDFPAVFAPGGRADFFRPFPLSPETNRRGNTLALIGKLKPGVSIERAQAEATVIGERVRTGNINGVSRNGFRPNLSTLRQRVSGRFREALLILTGAIGFLMLLVCANLSNLLLARATARHREMAVRTALGASRWRLIRQMLCESGVLACCGAVLGLVLTFVAVRSVTQWDSTSIPLLSAVRVDGVVLAFTIAAAMITGVVFGLVPALQASNPAPNSALKEAGRSGAAGGGRERSLVRASLVVCEIALACVLLTSAGLLVRSLMRVLDVELGFETENVLALRTDPNRTYSAYPQKLQYFDAVLRAARSVPGVQSAGLTDALPLGDNFGWRNWTVGVQGQTYEKGQTPVALVRVVDDGYLQTMKIPIRAGRDFTLADNTSTGNVAIINRTLAKVLWPGGEDPVGRMISTSRIDRQVIGVVDGVRYFGSEKEAGAEMYLPIRQCPDFSSIDLVVRGGSAKELRTALKSMDPNMPVSDVRTMQNLVDRSVFARKAVMSLLAGFALFGLILAALGIYAVISYSVTQRRQEMGIRMALGASAGDLLRRILGQTLKLAAVGLLLGVPASWLVARVMQGLLFGVSSTDPLTFAGVLLLLAAVAGMAGYLPARRAAGLNPADALRCE